MCRLLSSLVIGAVMSVSAASADEAFVDALLARMTFEEKVGQTVQLASGKDLVPVATDSSKERAPERLLDVLRRGGAGALSGSCGIEKFNLLQRTALESRLRIPLLVGTDVIHGGRIAYPIPLALACAWDEDLWEKGGAFNAVETGCLGANWTYAPMVDIARDARWGRIAEGPGQDPLIAARFAAAMVRGIQRQPTAGETRIAACLKHYVGYGAAVAGRDYNEVDMSERQLFDIYLPPFAAGVKAGALTVMPGFHSFNGVPCSTNRRLLDDILRGRLGFDGLCVSDNGAIHESGPAGHYAYPDMPTVAAASLAAGMNMDMVRRTGRAFPEGLPEAQTRGILEGKALDARVREILLVKKRLGLFERPLIDPVAQSNAFDVARFSGFARKAVAPSVVLLKNRNGVLPLKRGLRVTVVGEAAHEPIWGCWAMFIDKDLGVSLEEGLRKAGVNIVMAGGFDLKGERTDEQAIRSACVGADVVIGCFGEASSGENTSRAVLELPANQLRAAEIVRQSGKPFVAVLFNGRPLAVPELAEACDALLEAWGPGSRGGDGLADVLTGKVEPGGRLVCDLPRTTGQCPIYYNRPPTGRPADPKNMFATRYIDCPVEPLFSFGEGMGYTSFAYSDVKADVRDGGVALSCVLANVGSRKGVEVVQVYVRRLYDGTARPLRELADWRRVELDAGETRAVSFDLPLGPGTYDVFVAHDSTSGDPVRVTVPPTGRKETVGQRAVVPYRGRISVKCAKRAGIFSSCSSRNCTHMAFCAVVQASAR